MCGFAARFGAVKHLLFCRSQRVLTRRVIEPSSAGIGYAGNSYAVLLFVSVLEAMLLSDAGANLPALTEWHHAAMVAGETQNLRRNP
ncbi:MAG: hypothetical protein AAFV69_14075 [Pseudomonadota bacterium]